MQSFNWVNLPDPQAFLPDPDALLSQPIEVQLAIANHRETPRQLLAVLVASSNPAVAEATRLHITWTDQPIADWQSALDSSLQTAQLGQNDRLAVELLKFAPVAPAFVSRWIPADSLMPALHNAHMPLRYRLQWLERLAQEPTLEPRLQVAESPETPQAMLELLAGDLELAVRLAARSNPNCPSALIELVEGQHAAAADWQTEAEQLALLGQSCWAWMRLTVAQNPSSPAATLEQLAADAICKIQLAVAQNPATPAAILAQLADHPEAAVRGAVAQHPNASESILLQLLPEQRSPILQRPKLPAGVLQHLFDETATAPNPDKAIADLRYLLLKQPHTPEPVLAALSEYDPEAIRTERLHYLTEVVRHPNVSVRILERLADCPDPKVRLAVAQHPIAPESIQRQLLEELAVHSDRQLQTQVASDPNTPTSILTAMAQRELYLPKLLDEIRRVITAEYPPNSHSYASTADSVMSRLKHELLKPAGLSVEVDRWMQLIESPDLLAALAAGCDFRHSRSSSWPERLAFRFADLLPELDNESLQQLARTFCDVLEIINADIKTNAYYQTAAVALAGNPSTPVALRDQLKTQLQSPRPADRGMGSRDEDCELLLAIAHNPQESEAERQTCFKRLMAVHQGRYLLAADPRTSPEILEQLLARSEDSGAYGQVDWQLQEKLAKNPATPDALLRQLVEGNRDAIWRIVGEYANPPVDLLLKILYGQPADKVHSNVSTADCVLRNPNLPLLERYRFRLSQELAQETAKANELLARRPDSPFALSQVVKQGDRNAKLTAARSPKTPITILEQLATDPDETVRSVVIENANLPLQSLLQLTQDDSINVRANLARHRPRFQVPPAVLERLAQDEAEQVRIQVASNPDTPVQILTQLMHDPSPEVCRALTRNSSASETILEVVGIQKGIVNPYNAKTPGAALAVAMEQALAADYYHRDKRVKEVLKNHSSQMPAELLEKLAATLSTDWMRSLVAHHQNTPDRALRSMAADNYGPVLWGIARNRNASTALLEQLLDRTDLSPQDYQQICGAMVERADLPPSIMERLLQTAGAGVRQRIATRSNLPSDLLDHLLATEFNEAVLVALARNPLLSSNHLAQLAQNPNPQVYIALINHPNLTPALWEQLAHHPESAVRQAIVSSPNCPQAVLEQLLLTELFESADALTIRQKIAAHPNATPEMLIQLSHSASAAIRAIVAAQAKTPLSVLETLAQDAKVEVRRAVAQSPNTPPALKAQLRDLLPQSAPAQTSPTLRGLPQIYSPQTDDLAEVLTQYAQSENAFVRFVALLHPLTPPEILQQRASSLFWLERCAIAENPATPEAVREQLTQDSNRIVRAVAAAC